MRANPIFDTSATMECYASRLHFHLPFEHGCSAYPFEETDDNSLPWNGHTKETRTNKRASLYVCHSSVS
jgi:hypothetical protein